jgi:hypothetical protein
MLKLTPEQTQQYLFRSYTAVDGLWFMTAEEAFGFDAALDLDAKVWAVVPKIQARQMKSFVGDRQGLDALKECFTSKLRIDGFIFSEDTESDQLVIHVSHCPWHDRMVRADRSHLSVKVGDRICPIEYSVWASEFGCTFRFGSSVKQCEGGHECVMEFNVV